MCRRPETLDRLAAILTFQADLDAIRKAITMEDGGAIILSVAKFYSPEGGKAIQDVGVTPGTVVSDADAQIDVDDNGEPLPDASPDKGQVKKVEDDAVVKKALQILK